MKGVSPPGVDGLVDWLRQQPGCIIEDGLTERELDRAEEYFGIRFPPLWRATLDRVHPIAVPKPPRGPDGILRWNAYPDWRMRDDAQTRDLIETPLEGLLFDVERCDFWWTAWGPAPDDLPTRLRIAAERLADVPRLVPLWSHLYVAPVNDGPVFSIVQADLYIPALSVIDLPTGRNQNAVPVPDWPIGSIPFWSDLHAYSQCGHLHDRFGRLGTGGL